MINEKDITFICAGKIFFKHNLTFRCLRSIRRFFPNSKIILSTWDGEYHKKLSKYADEVIYNREPENIGSTCLPECDWYPKENSYNRQQVLVSTALKVCNTKYVVKFRTDFIFKKNCFIKFYETFLNVLGCEASIFKQKVLIYSCGTINPKVTNLPLPHHPSDLFFFGLTEDINLIYDGRFISKDLANYYLNHNEYNPALFNHLYTPEQFLWLQLLDKLNITYKKPKNYFEINERIAQETLYLFSSNFIVLDQPHLGFKSKFDKKFKYKDKKTRFLTTKHFLDFYKYIFGSSKKLEHLCRSEKVFYDYNCSLTSISKHMKILFKYLGFPIEILVMIYYCLLTLFLKIRLLYNEIISYNKCSNDE